MTSSVAKRTILLCGYIREILGPKMETIPNDIRILIEIFYPILIDFSESKIILIEEKRYITEYLTQILTEDSDTDATLSAVLLYEGERDGLSALEWHSKVDGHKNTLSIIQTNYGNVFGCFASEPWGRKNLNMIIFQIQNHFYVYLEHYLNIENVPNSRHLLERMVMRIQNMDHIMLDIMDQHLDFHLIWLFSVVGGRMVSEVDLEFVMNIQDTLD